MPKQDSERIKQRKREWYQRNKDEILKRKRERRAAQRKPKLPQPKPAPTPKQIARTRELNRQACYRYRAIHLAQVRFINRVYYHRSRDRIVQQQRDRRALAKQNKQNPDPFRKLGALTNVCSEQLIELDHGYAGEEKETRKKTNVESQRRYRERKNAAVDGMEEVRARNRKRYYERMARLKATRQYEAFKKHKSNEGMRRYNAMPAEQREEVKLKNLILQKAWRERMIREGTYEEYRRRLNARRREQLAGEKRAMSVRGWKEYQTAVYAKRAESERRKRWNWLEEQLARPFPLPWLPLDWAAPVARTPLTGPPNGWRTFLVQWRN